MILSLLILLPITTSVRSRAPLSETKALFYSVGAIHDKQHWGCTLEDEIEEGATELSFFFNEKGDIIRSKLIDGATTYDFYVQEEEDGTFHAFIGDRANMNNPGNVKFDGGKARYEQMKRLGYLPFGHLSFLTRMLLRTLSPKGKDNAEAVRKKCRRLVARLLKNPPHGYSSGTNWFLPFHRDKRALMKTALKIEDVDKT